MKKTILAFLMFLTLLSISCKGPVDPVPINRTTFTDRAGRYLGSRSVNNYLLTLNDLLEEASLLKDSDPFANPSGYERADSARTGASLVFSDSLTITFTGENTAVIVSIDSSINGLTLTRGVNRLTFEDREGNYTSESTGDVLNLTDGTATYTVNKGTSETVNYDRGELAQEYKLVLEFSSFNILFNSDDQAMSYNKDGTAVSLNRPQRL